LPSMLGRKRPVLSAPPEYVSPPCPTSVAPLPAVNQPRLKRNLGAMASMVGQWQMEVSLPVGGSFFGWGGTDSLGGSCSAFLI
jgi:hypothetical protein